MKVKINSVDISIQPAQNFRTTKGGKRILIGNPAISLNCTLGIDIIPQLRVADVVGINGQQFLYYPQQGTQSAYLRNVTNQLTRNFSFNTNDEIEINSLIRMYAEGQGK